MNDKDLKVLIDSLPKNAYEEISRDLKADLKHIVCAQAETEGTTLKALMNSDSSIEKFLQDMVEIGPRHIIKGTIWCKHNTWYERKGMYWARRSMPHIPKSLIA